MKNDFKHSGDRKFKKPFKKNPVQPPDPKKEFDGNQAIRLNRYIANAGICSRREADKLIATGVVSVNGKIVTEMGVKVTKNDSVQFGGETLRKEKMVYVLLNKPKDYITTTDDPDGRKTVMVLVKDACKERIYPVGRLDRATTGLLLMTNDGEMAKKLMHPKHRVKKIYHVELDHNLLRPDIEKIYNGIELEDGTAKVDEISYDGDGADKKSIGVELHIGKNRIVRRIFESLGYKVVKLDRVYYAGLTKKDLPRGKWRFLTQMEINMLKMIS
jgi:23S rRNA pseudouridine2605 synthase